MTIFFYSFGGGAVVARLGRTLLTGLLLALLPLLALAQSADRAAPPRFFQAEDAAGAARAAAPPQAAQLREYRRYTLDLTGLRTALATAPLTGSAQARAAGLVLALPLPDGRTGRFEIAEAPIMEPALAARYPEIKTYAGVGLDDATATVRLDLSPLGFRAQILSATGGAAYIEPFSSTDQAHYLAYYGRDVVSPRAGTLCNTPDLGAAPALPANGQQRGTGTGPGGNGGAGGAQARSAGAQLRTLRLAVATTGEFTRACGTNRTTTGGGGYLNGTGGTRANALAVVVSIINQVVGITETELAVRLVLVANTDQVMYLDPATDPYTNPASQNQLLTDNQTAVDGVITNANYDVSQVFDVTTGGGLAGVGTVGRPGSKAIGMAGFQYVPAAGTNNLSLSFNATNVVTHELGHQMGAGHTFNSTAPNCATGRSSTQAWEPGAGTTIMAYTNACNVDGTTTASYPYSSDPNYHTGSFEKIQDYLFTSFYGAPAGSYLATGNTAPTVTVPAGGKVLPISTPFRLRATGSDANGDALTYSWEELDLGPAARITDAQVAGQAVPLFRVRPPVSDPMRYFPPLSNLLNNTSTNADRLPTVSRALNFRCAVRDQRNGSQGVVGGVDYSATVALSATSAAGPFVLTSPNSAVQWDGNTTQTVTWNVAGTTGNGVNCARVNIRLSTDGGLTYPTLMAANTPNDGSKTLTMPNVLTTSTARVMVEAADNYFFDISDTNFTSGNSFSPGVTSLSPGSGPAGTLVTIRGFNFVGSTFFNIVITQVTFGGVSAAYTVVDNNTITATVPATGLTGEVIIYATLNGSAFGPGHAGVFVVTPSISSFAPGTGVRGQAVTVAGNALAGITALTVGGVAVPLGTVLNNTNGGFTFRVPPTAALGAGTLSLTNGEGNTLDQPFTVNAAPAPPGNALAFDGGNDEAVSTTTAPVFGTGDYTLEAWVRATGTAPTYNLALGSVGGNSNDYWLGMKNGFAATSATGAECVSTTAVNDGRWHHLAGVRSGGNLTLYVDGVAVKTIANALAASPTAPLGIGSFGNGSTFWQGSLDEVRLWNVARTPAQLLAAMTTALAGSETGLVRYFNFDQGTGNGTNTGQTTLYDQTSSGAASTLNNFALTGSTSNWVESYALVRPTATAPTASTASAFTANWTAPATGVVTDYRLDVATDAAFTAPISGSPFTVAGTSRALTGLNGALTYYYRVRADKTSVTGQGTPSNTISRSCTVTALARAATVQLAADGTGTLTTAQVDNGSTASCGFDATTPYALSKTAFGCADLGSGNTVTLTVKDAAGQTATATATITVLAPPTATLGSLSASTAAVGQTVTVSGGTNLGGTTAVTVNGASAAVSGVSAAGFSFVVPAGAATTGNVVLALACSQSFSAPFTVVRVPTITSFGPAGGPVGTVITVTGTNLNPLSSVRFGEVPAITFSVNAAGTTLTVTVPRLASTQKLRVTNLAGSALSATAFAVTRATSSYGFAAVTGSTLNTLDVGNQAVPIFGDVDGDGLLDLVVGEDFQRLYHYEQSTGTSNTFALVPNPSLNNLGFPAGSYDLAPALTDLDGDGRLDLLTASSLGTVRHVAQTASGSQAFTVVTNNFNGVAVSGYTAITMTDLDGNGLLDFVVVAGGALVRYEQSAANALTFAVAPALTGISTGSGFISVVTVADIDGDGLLDAVAGYAGASGSLIHYEQTAANALSFAAVAGSPINALATKAYPVPAFTDTDNDGLLDLVVGYGDGTFSHYEQAYPPTALALSNNTLAENVAANTTVGTLSTTDLTPGDTFTYSFAPGGADNAAFTITGSTLTINASPNFEAKASYAIRLRTTDNAGQTFDQAFTVTITDVAEAPTAVALTPANINENVPAGSTVGTLSSTDPDAGSSFTYSFVAGGADNAAFTITGSTLTINVSPDFETKASYSILVRTTDNTGLTFDQALTVTINDLPETPTIASFAPATGPVGTVIIVTGTNLNILTSVRFGEVPAIAFSVNAAGTTLSVTVPRLASTQKLSVRTSGGSVLSGTAFAVTRPSSSYSFALRTASFAGISRGADTYLAPTVADLNGNGQLELLLGNSSGQISRYEQTAATALTLNAPANLGGIFATSGYSRPVVTDLDGNGRLDVLTGNYYGNVMRFEQTTAGGTAFGTGANLTTDGTTAIVVGTGFAYSTPAITDLDGDGLLDLLVGAADGKVRHFEQTLLNGIIFAPSAGTTGGFLTTNGSTAVTVSQNQYSAPTIADVDGDGLLDLLVGMYSSFVERWEQAAPGSTNFVAAGGLTTDGSTALNVSSALVTPTLTDLDNNGLLDLLVGKYDGTVSHYEQVPPPVPTIAATGLNPTSGPVGTTISLTGTGLNGATAITFGGSSGNVVSSGYAVNGTGTLITGIVVPAGAISGTVTVTTGGGTSAASAQTFTVTPSLSALALSAGSPLSPAFASGTLSYTLAVPSTTTSTTVTPTNAQTSGGTITVNGTAVASGSASGAIALNPGSNTLTVVVNPAGAGTATTYTVAVTRACAVTALAQNVSVTLAANGSATVAATAVNNGSSSTCGAVTLALSQTAFTCANVGANLVTLTVTDGFGGSATASATVTVLSPPAATLTGLSPNPAVAGQTVTATGTNLSGATALTVNGVATTLTGLSATGFTFVVPGGATNSGSVAVAAPCGQSVSSAFSILPAITSFTPATGPVGTSVVITGTNLGGATGVGFAGTAQPTITANTATSLTATVPAGAVTGGLGLATAIGGAASAPNPVLRLLGTGGTSSDNTAYFDQVEIIDASGAVVAGGVANGSFEIGAPAADLVYNPNTVTGWFFANNAAVSTSASAFGPPPPPNGTHVALLQLGGGYVEQTLTLGAGTYRVRFLMAQRQCCALPYDQSMRVLINGVAVGAALTTGSGSYVQLTSLPFTVTSAGVFFVPPTLTAVAPNPGGRGQRITLTGNGLANPTALTINGANALGNVISNTGTSLVVWVPLTATASGTVSITTAGGTASLPFAVMAAPGNALALDGADDYVRVAHNAAFNITAAITVEAWVRTSATGEQYITTKGDDSWYLAMNVGGGPAGVASFYLGGPSDASGGWLYGTTPLGDGRWHHVAGTYDGATLRLYVDGGLQNSRPATGAIRTGTSPVDIGARTGFAFWNGRLDEFRLYNTALTAAQLRADMTSTAAAVPASLVLHYNMDQGTPATASTGDNTGLTTLLDLVTTTPGTLTNFALASGNTTSNYVESYALVVPTATAATAVAATAFTANWTAPALGTVDNGYRLDVATDAAFTAPASGSPFVVASGLSKAVSGLTASTTYYYRVRADKTSVTGQGTPSNVVSVALPSNVSSLSSLVLSAGSISPAFASGTLGYTLSTASTTTTVTPTRTQANATITVNGTAVASGAASGSIALSPGSNTITVVVTAQDGSTQSTYTVAVTRTCVVTALAQNVSVTLDASGNATVTAAAVDNGSNSTCGAVTLGLGAGAEQLSNGSFTTDASGWTPANVDTNGGWRGTGGNPGGLFILNDNGGLATDPTLTQVVSGLVPGTTYVLAGDYRNYYASAVGAIAFGIDVNGTQRAALPSPGTTWTAFRLAFVASASSQTLALRGEINGTDYDIALDNLSLRPASTTQSFTCASIGANPVTLAVTDGFGNAATASATVTVLDTTPPVFASNGAGTSASPFISLNGARGVATGTYWFTIAGNTFQGYVDGSTDGGGWVEILNYVHQGGTNPALNARTTSLPVQTSAALGANEGASPTAWGHAAPALVTSLNPQEVRFYGQTSGHSRILHFKTTHAGTLSYFKTGVGSMAGIGSSFTALSGHTANLPAQAVNFYSDQGTLAMTNFPFWLNGTYHWGIQGQGNRWEVDDFPGNESQNTIHRVFVRGTAAGVAGNPVAVANTAGQCGATVNLTGTQPVSDNCAGTTVTFSPASGTLFAVGTTAVTATATDASGNTATSSFAVTVTDTQPPTAVAQNATVTLNASGVASITAAQVNNGSSDNCTAAGSLTLAVSPSSFSCANVGANPVTLTVTDASGNASTATATVTVTAPAPATLTGLSPNPALPGATVTATGTNLSGATALTVNGVSATISGLSTTGFTFVVPSGATNTGNVVVTVPCSQSITRAFSILPAIASNGLNPTSGPVGTPVTITGTNLGGATSVSFNGGVQTTITSNTATSLTVAVPAGATTGILTVTTAGGTSAASAQTFTVTPSLNNLVLSAGTISPAFASGTTSYTLTVPGTTTTTTVTPTNAQTSGGTITVNGTTVASGVASGAIALVPGSNTLTVVVNPAGAGTALTYTVTVTRTPCVVTATAQNVSVTLDASGNATVAASAVNNGSSSTCGAVTLALSQTAFTCANVGANAVTLTVTDGFGGSAAASATVTVTDGTAPTAVAQAVAVSVAANGRVYVAPTAVNNGSSDNCAVTNVALSASTFGSCNASAALAFDGADDYVSLPSGLTNGATSFTFEGWVNYQDNGFWTRIFDFGTGTNTWMTLGPRSGYAGNSGNIFFGIVANRAAVAEENIFTTTPMPTGWHHLALTIAPNGTGTNTGRIYLDGAVIGTNAALTLTPAALGTLTQNYLGKSQYVDPYLKGQLDEVRIWNTARTAAEINLYKDKSLAGTTTGLLAYYDCNDGAGSSTVLNRGSLGGTATLNNFATATAFVGPGQVPALGTGAQTVTLTVSDKAGNVSSTTATVTVSVPTPTLATWTGAASTDWTSCANWQYGTLPTATVSAMLPAAMPRYPSLPAGTYPVLDLTLASGSSLATASTATLQASGSFANNGGTASLAGPVVFTGTAAQSIGGSSATAFATVTVNKASGSVSLGRDLAIGTALTLTSGTLTTGSFKVALGNTATLTESETSYVSGAVETTRALSTAGTGSSFGGIGVTLTPAASSTALPGSTLVRRLTGTPATGVNSSTGIARYFVITPTVDANLNLTLVFGYRDGELNGIAENRLKLFKSATGAAGPWARIDYATYNATANTVTRTNIASLSTWTLGNALAPLPVELLAFTAEKQGTAVQLKWQTASERNSDRFEVERSRDGRVFDRIGTVAAAGNTSRPSDYAFLDSNYPGETNVLYYRLHQVDTDGSASYSPVRAVTVGGKALLTLYPNPARTAVVVGGLSAGATVEVFDALGQTVVQATADVEGTARITLPAGLAAGVYVVRSGTQVQRLTVE